MRHVEILALVIETFLSTPSKKVMDLPVFCQSVSFAWNGAPIFSLRGLVFPFLYKKLRKSSREEALLHFGFFTNYICFLWVEGKKPWKNNKKYFLKSSIFWFRVVVKIFWRMYLWIAPCFVDQPRKEEIHSEGKSVILCRVGKITELYRVIFKC